VADEEVLVFIEIPSGSRNKYEWDPELGAIKLDRFLFSSVVFPTDYGFIKDTLGEDGDALDALVLVGDPTFPGCRVRVRVIGVFYMEDEKGSDEKVICVSQRDPAWSHAHDIHDLFPEFRAEIEQFFQVYKQLEHKKISTRGFGNRAEALEVIAAARERLEAEGQA
jgi:inorganic pyrophosphatase